jgi:hypothetical protein
VTLWIWGCTSHEICQTYTLLHKEDQHIFNVVLGLVGNLHNQVLELGPIDPLRRGGSRRGKRPNIARGIIEGHERLMKDHFVENPIYDARMFCQRFRMSRHWFLRILESVQNYDSYFVQKLDATGQLGLNGWQKCTTTLRILAYGITSDATNEYVQLALSASMLALKRFVQVIRVVYKNTYLRQPTREDLKKQVAIDTERGWLGMFASLDCMHYIMNGRIVLLLGKELFKTGRPNTR